MREVRNYSKLIKLEINPLLTREYSNLYFDENNGILLNIINYDLNKYDYTKLLLSMLEYGNSKIEWGIKNYYPDELLENLLILEKIKISKDDLKEIKNILIKYEKSEILKIIKKLYSVGILDVLDFLKKFEKHKIQDFFEKGKRKKQKGLKYYSLNEINNLTLFFKLKEKGINLYERTKSSKDKNRRYIVNHISSIYSKLENSGLLSAFGIKKDDATLYITSHKIKDSYVSLISNIKY